MKLRVERGAKYEYRDEETGKGYFSVSQVLNVLHPDAFAGADPDVLNRASQRGRRTHSLFARLLLHFTTRDLKGREKAEGLGPMPACPESELQPYFLSMLTWCQAMKPQAVKIEEASIAKDQPLSGRPDALVWLMRGNKKRLVLLDLKSGAPMPTHVTQLNVYHHLEGYDCAEDLCTVYAQKDGRRAKDKISKPDPFEWAWALNGLAVLKGRLTRGV